MPTWPVDVPTIKKFMFRNTVLMMPLVAELSGLHETWVKAVQGSLENLAG
jgi:hypothetical protein